MLKLFGEVKNNFVAIETIWLVTKPESRTKAVQNQWSSNLAVHKCHWEDFKNLSIWVMPLSS